MERKNLQLKLQEKISSDFNSLFKNNDYKNVQNLKKNSLVDFDYLKSTSINKIKFLCHNTLDTIQNLIQNFLTVSKENPLMLAFEKTLIQIQTQIEKLEIDKKNLQETNSNLQKKITQVTPLLENLKAFNNDLIDDVQNVIKQNDSNIKKFLIKNVQKFNKDKNLNQRIKNSFKNIENLITKNLQGSNEQDVQEKHNLMTNASLDILNTFQQFLILHQNCDVTNKLEGRQRSMSPHQDNQTVKKQLAENDSLYNENSDKFLMPHKFSKSQNQKKQTLKLKNQEIPQINIRGTSKKQLLQTTPLRPSINKKKSVKKNECISQTMQPQNNKYELTLRLIKEDKDNKFRSDVKKKKLLVNELKNFTNNFLDITISSDEDNYLLNDDQIEAIKNIIKNKKENRQNKKKITPVKEKQKSVNKKKSKKDPIQNQKNIKKNQTLKAIQKKKVKNLNESQASIKSHKEVTLINYKIDDFLNQLIEFNLGNFTKIVV